MAVPVGGETGWYLCYWDRRLISASRMKKDLGVQVMKVTSLVRRPLDIGKILMRFRSAWRHLNGGEDFSYDDGLSGDHRVCERRLVEPTVLRVLGFNRKE